MSFSVVEVPVELAAIGVAAVLGWGVWLTRAVFSIQQEVKGLSDVRELVEELVRAIKASGRRGRG